MSVSQSVGRLQLIAFSRLHRVELHLHMDLCSHSHRYCMLYLLLLLSFGLFLAFRVGSFAAAALAAVIKNPSMWGPDALLAAVIKIYMTPTAARRYT